MTDFKKAFVDTAPFIYFIEKDINNPQYYETVKCFFRDVLELLSPGRIAVSEIKAGIWQRV